MSGHEVGDCYIGPTTLLTVIPMTHAPETEAINRLHFFWRRFLVRVSFKSVPGFVWHQKPAPNRTLLYSKPETAVHVTEMMIYHHMLFIFVISCK